MTSQYCCKTCNKIGCRIQIMKYKKYSFEKTSDYELDPHDKCEDISEFVQGIEEVGCASHSDFQNQKEKVLDEVIAKLNDLYERKYDPRPCNRTDDGGMYNDNELDVILEIQKDIITPIRRGKEER